MNSHVICLQCFVKIGILRRLLNNLEKLIGIEKYTLVIYVDSANKIINPNMKEKEDELILKNRRLINYVKQYRADKSNLYKDIILKINSQNKGPYASSRECLDYCFTLSDYVIFTEDDTVIAKDALLYFEMMYEKGLLDDEKCLVIAGESKHFDSKDREVSKVHVKKMKEKAEKNSLNNYFTKFNIFPPTAFATTKKRWQFIRQLKGKPAGDGRLTKLCQSDGYYSIFPIVARVKDIGMTHALGFSTVQKGGSDKITNLKNSYLMSDDLEQFTSLDMYQGNNGSLISLTR